MRLILFILLFSLPCFFLNGQISSFGDLANMAREPDFPLRLRIEQQLSQDRSLEINMFMSSLDPKGIFLQQVLLPIIQDHEQQIDFQLHFLTGENGRTSINSTTSNQELEETRQLVAIQQMYPDRYLEYLIARGASFFQEDWRTTATNLRMDDRVIESQASSEGVTAVLADHTAIATRYVTDGQVPPLIFVGGEALNLTPSDLSDVDPCCNFYGCLGNCLGEEFADNVLETTLYLQALYYSCGSCSNAPLPQNLTCWLCVGTVLAGVFELTECLDDCQNDPCDNDGAVYCTWGEYCHKTTTMLPTSTLNAPIIIQNASCEQCPTIEPTLIQKRFIRINAHKPQGFNMGIVLAESEVSYDYRLYKNNVLVANETVFPTFGFFEDTHHTDINLANYAIQLGDEFRLYINGNEDYVDCPIREFKYEVECPSVSFDVEESLLHVEVSDNYLSGYTVQFSNIYIQGSTPASGVSWQTGSDNSHLYENPLPQPNIIYCVDYVVGSNPDLQIYNIGLCGSTFCHTMDICETLAEDIDILLIDNWEESAPGAQDGLLNIGIDGGIPPYTIYWDNDIAGTLNDGLSKGDYCVTVTDANNCTEEACFYVSLGCEPFVACSSIDLEFETTNASTFDSSDGSVIVNPSGGFGFVYYWEDIPGSTTSNTRSNLAPGEYCLIVFNSGCCFGENCVTIEANCSLYLNTFEKFPCNGVDGEIDLIPINGTPPYSYEWSNGATTEDLNSLTYGTYQVVVTDGNGCTASLEVAFPSVPTEVQATITKSCPYSYDGSIDLTVIGGQPPFSFYWSTGATTEDLVNVGPGAYFVLISDANGCLLSRLYSVWQHPEMYLSAEATMIGNGQSNGSIDLTVNSGTAPYNYAWTDPNGDLFALNQDVANLSIPGTYCVTVSDANGCVKSLCVDVKKCKELSLSSSGNCPRITNPTTCNMDDGSIYFISLSCVQDYTAPMTFAWSNGGTALSQNNLSAGIYDLTVTDANGCTGAFSFELTTADTPEVLVSAGSTCPGQAMGSAIVTAFLPSDNSVKYDFVWSNGFVTNNANTSDQFDVLAAGDYQVTISSVNSECHEVVTVTIEEYPNNGPIVLTPEYSESCANEATGSIKVNVSGGYDLLYSYSWDTGSTSHYIYDLSPGTYCVTVTDFCGITASECFELEALPESDIQIDAVINPGNDMGSIDLYIEGGSGNYSYEWNTGDTTSSINNIYSGAYHVTVTDMESGCSNMASYNIRNCGYQPAPWLPLDPFVLDVRFAEGTNSDQDMQICNASPQTIYIDEISGSLPPYTLRIELINSITGATWTYNQTFNAAVYNLEITAPMGRHEIKAFDKCGNMNLELVDLCEFCGFDYTADGNIYTVGEGGLTFDLNCTCDDCGEIFGWGGAKKIRMDVHPNNIVNAIYTVTWPDGNTTTIAGGGYSISGPESYTFGEGSVANGVFSITISRSDGCTIVMPISLLDNGSAAVIFNEMYWDPPQGSNDYYVSTQNCDACVSVPGYFVESEQECDGMVNGYQQFFYTPNDFNNPCSGGGTVLTHVIINGVVQLTTLPIPPNVNLPVSTLIGGNGDALIEGMDCEVFAGGACAFDAINVYGFQLDMPLLVQYCSQFITEQPDSDGDGWPDSEDNCPDVYDALNLCEEIVDDDDNGVPDDDQEFCVDIFEVELDGGCDINVYCEYENGTTELLYTYDGDIVQPCRFMTSSGCYAVRAFCLCHYEVLEEGGADGNPNSTTYDESIYSCDDTSIPTCDEIFANCFVGDDGSDDRAEEDFLEDLTPDDKVNFAIFPNPYVDNITIKGLNPSEDFNADVLLINSLGQVMMQEEMIFEKGGSIVYFGGLENLPIGVYTLIIQKDSEILKLEKLVKMNR